MNNIILSTLWLLANQESFQGVAGRFGFSKGSLHHYFIQIVETLTGLIPKYICWPSPEQYPVVAERFERKGGFPGVIGCIDGTHIPIKGPSAHRDVFINRNGYATFQLQAVCDSQLRSTHIHTGNAGSVHDSRVYRNSDLKAMLNAYPLPAQYHLLGDSAYPLDTNLLVPYRDNGHLMERQKRYNNVHKWRRLHFLDMALLETITKVIASTCILHNFSLTNEGDEDNVDPTADVSADPADDAVPVEDNTMVAQRRAAEQNREDIAAVV